jgi:KDO2-lipid IV(A) lauroyltransferase
MTQFLRRFRHGVEYAAVRGVLALAGSLPIGLARGIGAAAGALGFALGVRRRVSIDNITASLGVSPAEARRIARRSYQNLGRSLMEFAAFRHWSNADLLRQVDFEGTENFERAREAGKGAVCVAGHIGNWEMLGAAVRVVGYPVNFLVGQQTNVRVDEVINDLRRAQGVGIIRRTSALRKVLQALRANEFVALLADQDARRGGVMVDFLGRPASTVRGPALFAVRSGCPLIPIFIHRTDGRHKALAEPPMWADPSLDEEAAVLDLTRRHAAALSRHVREHPEEYFWPHRRWKTTIV